MQEAEHCSDAIRKPQQIIDRFPCRNIHPDSGLESPGCVVQGGVAAEDNGGVGGGSDEGSGNLIKGGHVRVEENVQGCTDDLLGSKTDSFRGTEEVARFRHSTPLEAEDGDSEKEEEGGESSQSKKEKGSSNTTVARFLPPSFSDSMARGLMEVSQTSFFSEEEEDSSVMDGEAGDGGDGDEDSEKERTRRLKNQTVTCLNATSTEIPPASSDTGVVDLLEGPPVDDKSFSGNKESGDDIVGKGDEKSNINQPAEPKDEEDEAQNSLVSEFVSSGATALGLMEVSQTSFFSEEEEDSSVMDGEGDDGEDGKKDNVCGQQDTENKVAHSNAAAVRYPHPSFPGAAALGLMEVSQTSFFSEEEEDSSVMDGEGGMGDGDEVTAIELAKEANGETEACHKSEKSGNSVAGERDVNSMTGQKEKSGSNACPFDGTDALHEPPSVPLSSFSGKEDENGTCAGDGEDEGDEEIDDDEEEADGDAVPGVVVTLSLDGALAAVETGAAQKAMEAVEEATEAEEATVRVTDRAEARAAEAPLTPPTREATARFWEGLLLGDGGGVPSPLIDGGQGRSGDSAESDRGGRGSHQGQGDRHGRLPATTGAEGEGVGGGGLGIGHVTYADPLESAAAAATDETVAVGAVEANEADDEEDYSEDAGDAHTTTDEDESVNERACGGSGGSARAAAAENDDGKAIERRFPWSGEKHPAGGDGPLPPPPPQVLVTPPPPSPPPQRGSSSSESGEGKRRSDSDGERREHMLEAAFRSLSRARSSSEDETENDTDFFGDNSGGGSCFQGSAFYSQSPQSPQSPLTPHIRGEEKKGRGGWSTAESGTFCARAEAGETKSETEGKTEAERPSEQFAGDEGVCELPGERGAGGEAGELPLPPQGQGQRGQTEGQSVCVTGAEERVGARAGAVDKLLEAEPPREEKKAATIKKKKRYVVYDRHLHLGGRRRERSSTSHPEKEGERQPKNQPSVSGKPSTVAQTPAGPGTDPLAVMAVEQRVQETEGESEKGRRPVSGGGGGLGAYSSREKKNGGGSGGGGGDSGAGGGGVGVGSAAVLALFRRGHRYDARKAARGGDRSERASSGARGSGVGCENHGGSGGGGGGGSGGGLRGSSGQEGGGGGRGGGGGSSREKSERRRRQRKGVVWEDGGDGGGVCTPPSGGNGNGGGGGGGLALTPPLPLWSSPESSPPADVLSAAELRELRALLNTSEGFALSAKQAARVQALISNTPGPSAAPAASSSSSSAAAAHRTPASPRTRRGGTITAYDEETAHAGGPPPPLHAAVVMAHANQQTHLPLPPRAHPPSSPPPPPRRRRRPSSALASSLSSLSSLSPAASPGKGLARSRSGGGERGDGAGGHEGGHEGGGEGGGGEGGGGGPSLSASPYRRRWEAEVSGRAADAAKAAAAHEAVVSGAFKCAERAEAFERRAAEAEGREAVLKAELFRLKRRGQGGGGEGREEPLAAARRRPQVVAAAAASPGYSAPPPPPPPPLPDMEQLLLEAQRRAEAAEARARALEQEKAQLRATLDATEAALADALGEIAKLLEEGAAAEREKAPRSPGFWNRS